jgi:ribonuclease H / adenosylcobalamin/alpha-ribazole phosphatase
MRHGETLYLGRSSPDGIDLTPEGRRQIAAAAELFDAVRLDLVVASPMRRAMDTAGMIAARQQLSVEPVAELREITPGGLEGMELAEIFSQVLRFFSSPEVTWDTPFVGGETFRQLIARVRRFVETMLGRSDWTTALAVAHGGANMALIASVLGLGEGEIPKLEQDLGCINAIDFDGSGRALVRLLNLSAHDLLKAAMREPSSNRLRNLLESRGRELAGMRWRTGPDDPELY